MLWLESFSVGLLISWRPISWHSRYNVSHSQIRQMYFTNPSGESHWKHLKWGGKQNLECDLMSLLSYSQDKISSPPAESVGNRARLPIGMRNNTDSVSWTRLLPKPVRSREIQIQKPISPFCLLPVELFAISASYCSLDVRQPQAVANPCLHAYRSFLVLSQPLLLPQKMTIGHYIQWWTENNPDQSCSRWICENFQT